MVPTLSMKSSQKWPPYDAVVPDCQTTPRWYRWTRSLLLITIVTGTIVLANVRPKSWAAASFLGIGFVIFIVFYIFSHLEHIAASWRELTASVRRLRAITFKDIADAIRSGLKEVRDGIGRLIVGLLPYAAIGVVGLFLWYLVSPTTWLTTWYASEYNVDSSHVFVEAKPHDCDFQRAPLGNKECHFERSVTTDKDNNGKVTNVYMNWEKVDE